jgi:hypothetical protein
MKFYAVVATSPTSGENYKIAERIEQRILNSNPVMEAFGELHCSPVPLPLGFATFRERGSALRPSLGSWRMIVSFTTWIPNLLPDPS